MTAASVHRFRNTVAIHVGSGQTVYLPAPLAKAFAQAINACAEDVARSAFTSSNFPPVTLDLGRQPR